MWVPDAVVEHLREVNEEPDLSQTRYRLLRRLGRGGMGTVYAARDEELGREVAVKVSSLAPASADGLAARLRREARVLAQLEHPGIVPVHEAGVLPDGRVYYVMKLVRGERLDAWARGQTDRRVLLRLFQRICEAVAFAHAHGVIHRDLKPQNIMVGQFGEALVLDWGTAVDPLRVVEGSPGSSASAGPWATGAGTIIGTPAYMAPEQARGDLAALDARLDVYGLGAVLYFLLTGRPPFPEGNVRQVLEEEPAPVREIAPEVPKALASICRKAMAKEPTERYAGALNLAEDVGHFLDADPVVAHREEIWERVGRFAARNRVVLSLLGAYLTLRLILILLSR